MKKLLFAIFIALLALVITRLGLATGENVSLSLNLDENKAYKVFISCEKSLELDPPVDNMRNKWDEQTNYDFALNPNPEDTLHPGKYRSDGWGASGRGGGIRSLKMAGIDTTDLIAVREHFLVQLPKIAANSISDMLIPWYYSRGLRWFKVAASLAAEPFDDLESENEERNRIPKYARVMFLDFEFENKDRLLDRTVERMAHLYPVKAITVGDSWQVIDESLFDLPFHEAVTLTCKDRKGGIVTLGMQTKAGTDEAPIIVDTLGIVLSLTFHAEQYGSFEVVERTGLVPRGELEQKVEGRLRVEKAAGLEAAREYLFSLCGTIRIEFSESASSPDLDPRIPQPGVKEEPGARDSTAPRRQP